MRRVYDQNIRFFRPSKFDLDDFQRIAKHESSSWRDRAYTKGITRKEWQQVLKGVLILNNVELKVKTRINTLSC
jgi:hypothetical protein